MCTLDLKVEASYDQGLTVARGTPFSLRGNV